MSQKNATTPMPYHVQRIIRRYAPHLQSEIAQAVKDKIGEKGGDDITLEEIGECASRIILGEGNRRMEKLSMDAYRNGHSRPLQEVIDELRTSIAGPVEA